MAWLTPIQKQLPREGSTLSEVLTDVDLVSIGTAHLQQRILRASVPVQNATPRAAAAHNLYADEKSPDTLMIVRGSQVTILPHVFVLTPQFGNFKVQDGDIIASLQLTQKNIADPLRFLLPKTTVADVPNADRTKIAITLTGPLLSRADAGRQKIEPMALSIFLQDRKSGMDKLEESLKHRTKLDPAKLAAVCVIQRQIRGMTVRYVCPLRETGLYGEEGAFTKSLFMPLNPQAGHQAAIDKNRWAALFGNRLNSAVLENGDVLEFTLLDILDSIPSA
jgi:hypothetical protein